MFLKLLEYENNIQEFHFSYPMYLAYYLILYFLFTNENSTAKASNSFKKTAVTR